MHILVCSPFRVCKVEYDACRGVSVFNLRCYLFCICTIDRFVGVLIELYMRGSNSCVFGGFLSRLYYESQIFIMLVEACIYLLLFDVFLCWLFSSPCLSLIGLVFDHFDILLGFYHIGD